MKASARQATVERLRNRVQQLKRFKALAERRRNQIKRLTDQLEAEKRLTNALSRLAFVREQQPAVLAEVKKAMSRREAA